MPMHFSALPLLANMGAPASQGKREAGKGTNWVGRGRFRSLVSELEGFWTDTRQQHISGPYQLLLHATQPRTFSFQTEGVKKETETSPTVPKKPILALSPGSYWSTVSSVRRVPSSQLGWRASWWPGRVSVLHTGLCWCRTGHDTAFHLLFCSWTSLWWQPFLKSRTTVENLCIKTCSKYQEHISQSLIMGILLLLILKLKFVLWTQAFSDPWS